MPEQIHGGRAVFRLNGRIIGDVEYIEVRRTYTNAKKKPMGTMGATEIIIVDYDVDFSGEKYRVSSESLIAMGLEPKNLSPQDIMAFEGFQIEVQDVMTGEILERIKGAKLNEDSRNYRKGELTMERFSGVALLATDESEN